MSNKATNIFNHALDLSKDYNTLFISSICQSLEVKKEYFNEEAEDNKELEDILDLIETNLEANILRQAQENKISVSLAQFALEVAHGWRVDSNDEKVKITVEGISNEDLQDIINEGN